MSDPSTTQPTSTPPINIYSMSAPSSTGSEEEHHEIRIHTIPSQSHVPTSPHTSADPPGRPPTSDDFSNTANKEEASAAPPTPGEDTTTTTTTPAAPEKVTFLQGTTSKIDEAALMKKVKLYILPPLMAMYFFSFLDRVNISNASKSMEKYLPLTEEQYSACVSVLFAGYVTFEVPSNLLLKKVKPSTWFSRIMVSWGLVSMMQAWVTNYTGMMICRFFLGVCEAGLFPGLVFYITQWFTRRERAFVMSTILTMQSIAGIAGGLISYGALQLEGHHHLHGWSWIFIVEGAPTIFFGFIVWFWIHDHPSSVKWLTEEQKHFVQERVKAPPNKPITCDALVRTFTSPKILLWVLATFCNLCGLYGLSFFNVPVLNTFTGGNLLLSNAFSVPVYTLTFIWTYTASMLADRKQEYCLWMVISGFIGTIGLMLLGISLRLEGHFGFKYASLMLATAGCLGTLPSHMAWLSSGLVGSTETAAGIAFVNSLGNVGGVIGPEILGASMNLTGSYSNGAFGLMGVVFFGLIIFIILELVWPFHVDVKAAEEEDWKTGYGKTLRNLGRRFSARFGSKKNSSKLTADKPTPEGPTTNGES